MGPTEGPVSPQQNSQEVTKEAQQVSTPEAPKSLQERVDGYLNRKIADARKHIYPPTMLDRLTSPMRKLMELAKPVDQFSLNKKEDPAEEAIRLEGIRDRMSKDQTGNNQTKYAEAGEVMKDDMVVAWYDQEIYGSHEDNPSSAAIAAKGREDLAMLRGLLSECGLQQPTDDELDKAAGKRFTRVGLKPRGPLKYIRLE